MPAKTYDPKNVIITFIGVPITGFADGEYLSITPSGERYTKVSGADGEVARSKSNDRTHEVVITLLQTSLSNSYLSALLIAGTKGVLKVTDLNGSALWLWDEAWIRQPPDSAFEKEIGDRAWTFDTAQVIRESYGGNI